MLGGLARVLRPALPHLPHPSLTPSSSCAWAVDPPVKQRGEEQDNASGHTSAYPTLPAQCMCRSGLESRRLHCGGASHAHAAVYRQTDARDEPRGARGEEHGGIAMLDTSPSRPSGV